jgi:hypothetical protein
MLCLEKKIHSNAIRNIPSIVFRREGRNRQERERERDTDL